MTWGWGGGARGTTDERVEEVVQEHDVSRAYGEYASQIHAFLPPDEGLTPLEMHARQNNAYVWIQLRDIRVLYNERGLVTINSNDGDYDVYISNWRFVRIKDSELVDNEVGDQMFRLNQYTNTKYGWPVFDITDPKWVEAKSANGIITDTIDLNPFDDNVEGGV